MVAAYIILGSPVLFNLATSLKCIYSQQLTLHHTPYNLETPPHTHTHTLPYILYAASIKQKAVEKVLIHMTSSSLFKHSLCYIQLLFECLLRVGNLSNLPYHLILRAVPAQLYIGSECSVLKTSLSNHHWRDL